jgi:teichuronic acid biosynthesis glycosyltransferase TuaG
MPDDRQTFSVVIPVYNGEAYIQNAIKSCLQQTLLPNEIIVIDDGSNDSTASLVQSFSTELIRYKKNTQNHGPSFSRNRGIEMATGSWILFLDADDIFHPQKIAVVNYYLQLDKNIRAIGHSFAVKENRLVTIADEDLPMLKKISENDVLLKNPIVTPALAVAANNAVFFNEAMTYAEDHDFILRTAEKFAISYIDLPLCTLGRLPLTAGGISSHKWKMRKGEMKMYIDYCKRNKRDLLIPFLLLFSLIKHTQKLFFLPKKINKPEV